MLTWLIIRHASSFNTVYLQHARSKLSHFFFFFYFSPEVQCVLFRPLPRHRRFYNYTDCVTSVPPEQNTPKEFESSEIVTSAEMCHKLKLCIQSGKSDSTVPILFWKGFKKLEGLTTPSRGKDGFYIFKAVLKWKHVTSNQNRVIISTYPIRKIINFKCSDSNSK